MLCRKFSLQFYLFACKKIIINQNMMQTSWNFGYRLNVHFYTHVGFYFSIYAPSSKTKITHMHMLVQV